MEIDRRVFIASLGGTTASAGPGKGQRLGTQS